MTFQIFKILPFFFLIFSFNTIKLSSDRFSLKINLSNVIIKKGKFYIALYDNEKTFSTKNRKSLVFKANGKLNKINFYNLKKGEYSVLIYQDLNSNKKLDKFMSLPKEPYGASNNPNGFPTFGNTKFQINNNTTININIKI